MLADLIIWPSVSAGSSELHTPIVGDCIGGGSRYTLSYQVEPIKSSSNADIQVMLIMGLLSLAFICIPFLPGINILPRKIPIYKLIWKEHYRSQQSA